MSTLNLAAIKSSMQQKNDQQLMDILYYSQDDYEPSVLELIKDILRERGFSDSDIAEATKSYAAMKSQISVSKANLKASFWMRLFGFIIDAIILRVLWYGWFYFFQPSSENAIYGISLLISLIYFLLTEGLFSRTIGMMIVGLKIINANTNEKIGLILALSRVIGRLACHLTLGIGYLVMLMNDKKQALHDKIAQTFVVYA